jgi:hypothetical protein
MDVDEHEQISGSIAPIFAVSALAGPAWPGSAWALVEANHWPVRIGYFGIQIEHVPHPGDAFSIDLGDAPHVLAPWLQVVFGQAPTDGFPRDAGMFGEADQFTGQEFERPARAGGMSEILCKRFL